MPVRQGKGCIGRNGTIPDAAAAKCKQKSSHGGGGGSAVPLTLCCHLQRRLAILGPLGIFRVGPFLWQESSGQPPPPQAHLNTAVRHPPPPPSQHFRAGLVARVLSVLGVGRCHRGNASAPGAPGEVSAATVPPPTVWGHVSVWDFLAFGRTQWDSYCGAQGSKQRFQERSMLSLHSLATTSSNHA